MEEPNLFSDMPLSRVALELSKRHVCCEPRRHDLIHRKILCAVGLQEARVSICRGIEGFLPPGPTRLSIC
jgi:hypothetical protein